MKIYDTTLRDGEQTPGVALTADMKIEVAKALARLGCHIIDVGFPATSPDEESALFGVLDAKRQGSIPEGVELLVMCRSNPAEIQRLGERLTARGFLPSEVTILLFTSSSDDHLEAKLRDRLLRRLGINSASPSELRSANLGMVRDCIELALSSGFDSIEFGAEDASRTDLAYLLELVAAAEECGAKRYIFADTVGALSHKATRTYCEALRARFPRLQLASHFHNDYGLALSNALIAADCGFDATSVTVNGIGERAGNVALHTFVFALRDLCNMRIPGFDYSQVYAVSQYIAEITGMPLSRHEPIVGSNAFSHESGIHVHGVLAKPTLYESIAAESVGRQRRIVLGKHSGGAAIAHRLAAICAALEQRGVAGDLSNWVARVDNFLKDPARIRRRQVALSAVLRRERLALDRLFDVSDADILSLICGDKDSGAAADG